MHATDEANRQRPVSISLSERDRALARTLAAAYEWSVSDTLRVLMRREAERLGLEVRDAPRTTAS